MKETRILMGMPITIEIADAGRSDADIRSAIAAAFGYFNFVDQKFSTYKETSEITAFNKGLIARENFSPEMAEIFRLAEETKKATRGFFEIKKPPHHIQSGSGDVPVNVGHAGDYYDPSGIVKGWAIWNAAKILSGELVSNFGGAFQGNGFKNFFVDAGGDIQVSGMNAAGKPWSVGIQNPFSNSKQAEIVKKVYLRHNEGMATSGTYVRGQHIYNPFNAGPISAIVSLTVIGPNIYEADRFATAAFAMSHKESQEGIRFIEALPGFEGYSIDAEGIATMTSGFEALTH